MNHNQKVSIIKPNNLCMNCLGINHFVRECKSNHKCKRCKRPHHTLLHEDSPKNTPSALPDDSPSNPVTSHTAVNAGLKLSSLLRTCRILVVSPNGSSSEARALLDSASSAFFISDHLARMLNLPHSNRNTYITSIAGLSHKSPTQSITNFVVSPSRSPSPRIQVSAIIVPQVTCDLPLHSVPFDLNWDHLSDLQLADPDFGQPGRIDVLLGIDIFTNVMGHSRRSGPPGSPSAFETSFRWVLAGNIDMIIPAHITIHTSVVSGDDITCKFCEIEESPNSELALSLDEHAVVHHSKVNHHCNNEGRFIVPLPKRPDSKPIGESRSQAMRRFISLEHSLRSNNQFEYFKKVMDEYFHLGHAEPIPISDMEKPPQEVFYLPMHAVYKDSSLTTKIKGFFDASAKSDSGISLNDTLFVGPTVHSTLLDVLLRFRLHQISLVADVSRMYRAIELAEPDHDLHRFVWKTNPQETLQDYRMTRVTFGIAASSFAANMSIKQNALDFAHMFPLAAKAVDELFYVDDCLTGADTVEAAIQLQTQLQSLFSKGDFLLRKWNSNNTFVFESISPELQDPRVIHTFNNTFDYTKTLGIEWNPQLDHFRITIAKLPFLVGVTKCMLVSDIAKLSMYWDGFPPSLSKSRSFCNGSGN